LTRDDRGEFEAYKREMAARMAADDELAERALALNLAADRYDWTYQWSWLGLPVIQLPSDIVVLQEILWACRPQLVIETGIARGGSLILSASILELVGDGRVLGIDVDIRPHNRAALESHQLSHRIDMIEGSSLDPAVVAAATARAEAVEQVMVILDSDHTHDHVLGELRAYSPLVTPGQFLVVADTFIEDMPSQEHRPRSFGPGNSPRTALEAWQAEDPPFVVDGFTSAKLLVSASQAGYLRRIE
jgi:cephalosporin hydroxylase